jgi:uncharacterized protein (DUF488 family)
VVSGDAAELLTVGHGTLPAPGLIQLLHGAGVQLLVDVRSFPGSRRHPQFGRDELGRWLPEGGIDYLWDRRLGGRRRAFPASPNVALRDDAFRGYADHMATAEFADALDALLTEAGRRTTVVMCAESLWWRCHRRLLSDAAVLIGNAVVTHLFHDGRRAPHMVTDGVRCTDGHLVYDVGVDRPLPL